MEQNINKKKVATTEEIDIKKLASIICKNFFLFAFVIFSIVAGGTLHVLRKTPGYEISALIHIEADKSKRSPIHELIGHGSQEIQNEIEIFKSHSILKELVERNNLRVNFSRKGNTFFSYLTRSFFGGQLLIGSPVITEGGGVLLNKEGELRVETSGFSITFEGEESNTIQCDWEKPCLLNDDGFIISKSGAIPPGSIYAFSTESLKKRIDDLGDSFRFTPSGDRRQPQLIRVIFSGSDPFLGAILVNDIISIYSEKKRDWGVREAEVTEAFLEEITADLLSRLTEERGQLGEFQKKEGTVVPETQIQSLMSQSEKLRTTIRETEVKINILRGLREKTDSTKDQPLPSPAFIQDSALTASINKFNDLILEKRSMAAGITPEHPMMQKISGKINETSLSLKQLTDNILFSLQNELRGLELEYGKLVKEFSSFPENVITLNSLQTDIKITEEIYSFLLQKLYESGIRKSGTLSGVTVIDHAIADFAEKTSPKGKLYLLIIAALAFICGFTIVLLKDMFSFTAATPEEVENILSGLPVFATIPHMEEEKRETKELQWKETFRNLHSNINFSSSGDKQVVVITSSVPSEGKSFILHQLACTCASFNEKTIIVDADMRKPTQHIFNKTSKVPGLSDYLAGNIESFNDIIRNGELFDLIPAGEESPNPPLLLKSDKLADLIEQLKKSYRHILIDLPPVFAVTDPVFLVDKLDVMLFVARLHTVPVNALKNIENTLFSKIPEERRNIGVVINGIKPSFIGTAMSRVDYHGSYCGYGYGYGEKKKENIIKRISVYLKSKKK